MADVFDPASLIDAAQRAAAGGDYPAAERHLREAAAIQETALGSDHPDLATTLNNLAFVCERLNKFDEAERGYRRAHAIAVASLGPGHPFIATSLKNLVDFCAAHDVPIWKPPAPPSEEKTSSLRIEFASEPERTQSHPATVRGWRAPRTVVLSALVVAAIVVLVFAMQGRDAASLSAPAARVETTSPADRRPEPPRRSETRPTAPSVAAEPSRPRETGGTPASVTVLRAQLCSALERKGSPDWQCTPADGNPQPGTYVFYTRLLTNAETTVEHRWYQGERVHQVMRLRVIPSPGNGYRTFSGNTISADRAGDWKVELRAADGSLLQEERFVVR